MPIYVYECEDGHRFEVAQKVAEPPWSRCEHAGCDKPCRRVLTPTSFVLRGSGWAKDGYA